MQVHVLDICCSTDGREEQLHPVLLVEKEELVLVDCGYPGSLPLLQEALAKLGFAIDRLTALLLTHHDIDHTGAAFELLEACPQIKVYASAVEAPYISGEKKSLRLRQAEEIYPSLPESYKPMALAFQQALQALKPVGVDVLLGEGDHPFGEDVQLIATPGHTPGHLSLFIKSKGILIAADALVVENNTLAIANPQFTLDLPEAIASAEKLSRFPVSQLVCYHGGIVKSEIEHKFQQLLTKYTQEVPV